MFRFMATAVLALLAGACTSAAFTGDYAGASGKTLMVSKEVWNGYREYVGLIQSTNSGAFIVQVMNGRAVGYFGQYCPGGHCIAGKNDANTAMSECRAKGTECVQFAQSASILVNYKVEGQ